MNSIIKVLNNRVTYITLIFGLFGGALSLLLKIQDMKTYYPALASLLALVVSLLVSLLIKGKRNPRIRNTFKFIAAVLFVLFVGCAIVHTNYIIKKTFEYHEFDEMNRYVIGDYSDAGLNMKRKYPMLTDEQILYQKMGGPDGIAIFWNKSSIDNNIFILIISYCGVIIFFVASVTFLTELLAEGDNTGKRKRHTSAVNSALPQ
jgi:hypothetical protein